MKMVKLLLLIGQLLWVYSCNNNPIQQSIITPNQEDKIMAQPEQQIVRIYYADGSHQDSYQDTIPYSVGIQEPYQQVTQIQIIKSGQIIEEINFAYIPEH